MARTEADVGGSNPTKGAPSDTGIPEPTNRERCYVRSVMSTYEAINSCWRMCWLRRMSIRAMGTKECSCIS